MILFSNLAGVLSLKQSLKLFYMLIKEAIYVGWTWYFFFYKYYWLKSLSAILLLRPLYFLLGSEFKLNYLLQNNGVAVNGVTNGNNSWRKSHNKNFVGNQKHDASQRGGYVCFYCFLKEISYCCKISMTVMLSLNWYKCLQIWQKAVSSSTECTRKLQVQQ